MTIAEKPPQIPSAAETDPVKLGWMVGSPPPPDKIVRFADMSHYRFPQTRWSFSNFRQLIPTTNIARGDGPVCVLPRAERNDIDSLTFYPIAFAGIWQGQTLVKVIVFNWTMKVFVEVVFTPVTYAVVGFLKRREGVDTYDPNTHFTPFSLRDEGDVHAYAEKRSD